MICSGSSRSLGPRGPCPRGGDPGDEVVDALAEVVDAARAVDARDAGEEVVLGRRDAPTGPALGHVGGDLAVDLGVARVAEAELDPGAEHVADLHAEVHPARRRDDDVDAEGEAATGDAADRLLELVELGADGRPAVDDEEDVAVAVVGPALRAAAAVGLDRVDAVGAEVGLAPVDDAR